MGTNVFAVSLTLELAPQVGHIRWKDEDLLDDQDEIGSMGKIWKLPSEPIDIQS